jgi:transcriptional regulator of acetoin/glycerol metabolism
MFLHFFTFSNGQIDVPDLPERVRQKKYMSMTLAEVEKQHIIKMIGIHKNNILQTALALDISRDTLKKKLGEYGMRD